MNAPAPASGPGDRRPAAAPGTAGARPFQVVEVEGVRWRIRNGDWAERLRHILRDPDGCLANAKRQFKHSRNVTIARVPLRGGGGAAVVLRRLNYGKWLHRLRDVFRHSRARRALVRGWQLEQAGVATPRALAAAEVRCGRLPLRAYLITEEIPRAQNLQNYALRHKRLAPELIDAVAALLARLHRHGFAHRDLKPANILLDAQNQPVLIDLDGVRHWARLNDAEAVADLALLAGYVGIVLPLPPRDQRRFLEGYCAGRGRAPEDWRWWRRAIALQAVRPRRRPGGT